jgi:hypothetical protein
MKHRNRIVICLCLCLLVCGFLADSCPAASWEDPHKAELERLYDPQWYHPDGMTDLTITENDTVVCLHQGTLYAYWDEPFEEAVAAMESASLSELNGYLFFQNDRLLLAQKVYDEDGTLWFRIVDFEETTTPHGYYPYTQTPYLTDAFDKEATLKRYGITGTLEQFHVTFVGANWISWGFTYVKTDTGSYILHYRHQVSEADVYTEETFRLYAERKAAHSKARRLLNGGVTVNGSMYFDNFIERYDNGYFPLSERILMTCYLYPVEIVVGLIVLAGAITVTILVIKRRNGKPLNRRSLS